MKAKEYSKQTPTTTTTMETIKDNYLDWEEYFTYSWEQKDEELEVELGRVLQVLGTEKTFSQAEPPLRASGCPSLQDSILPRG